MVYQKTYKKVSKLSNKGKYKSGKGFWKGKNKQNYTYPAKPFFKNKPNKSLDGAWELNPLTWEVNYYPPKEAEEREKQTLAKDKEKYLELDLALKSLGK